MKNPYDIIVSPHITEKTVRLSYGDEAQAKKQKLNELKKAGTPTKGGIKIAEEDLTRKYTFIVAKTANKIEIKQALESIYNDGKKDGDKIKIEAVRTIKVLGKQRRRGKSVGYEPDRKKAVITLAKGQLLEDYGV